MTLRYYWLVLVFSKTFMRCCIAQQSVAPTFPNAENQSATVVNSVASISSIPNNIAGVVSNPIASNTLNSISTAVKRNDWWPPSEQEMTMTSPYTADVQPVSATYFIPAPPPPSMLSHYRSDQWSPYGYPESGYPITPPNANNQLGITPKYMAIALFIGLLTLFAIIQGSLMTAKQKEGLMDVHSRKKRGLLTITAFDNMTQEQQDIITNDAKIRCIQRTICFENRQLIRDFGPRGLKLATYLTRNVKNSLENAAGWDRLVEDAGAAGVRGENCNVLYRDCILPAITQSAPPNK